MSPDEIFNAGGDAAAAAAGGGGCGAGDGLCGGRTVTPYHTLYHCAGHARSAITAGISLHQPTTDHRT